MLFIADYEAMEEELKLTKNSIQKYLRRFCDIGMIKSLGKLGPRANTVYAVGYYGYYYEEKERKAKSKKNMRIGLVIAVIVIVASSLVYWNMERNYYDQLEYGYTITVNSSSTDYFVKIPIPSNNSDATTIILFTFGRMLMPIIAADY